jgi:sugar lactone lactonase YvrE
VFGANGTTSGNLDGTGTAALFAGPYSAVADAAGNTYVTDSTNNNIRKITTGNVVTTLATGFNNPRGITIDSAGNLYVCNTGTNQIMKVTSGGSVTTYAGAGVAGFKSGTSSVATFNAPTGITIDNAGNLLVADTGNNVIRKISVAGNVTVYAGSGVATAVDGTLAASSFSGPYAIAINSTNTFIYIADYNNNKIRRAYYA